MRQQLLDRNRRIIRLGRLNLEPGQIPHHRIVQPQLIGIAQLHDGRRSEQLAVRRHPKLSGRRHRSMAFYVGITVTGGPNQLLVRYYAHCNARQRAISQLRADPALE